MTGRSFSLTVIFCNYAIIVFEDPAFIGNYYGWKAKNVKGTEEWDEET